MADKKVTQDGERVRDEATKVVRSIDPPNGLRHAPGTDPTAVRPLPGSGVRGMDEVCGACHAKSRRETEDVVRAWTVSGPHPGYHERMREVVRRSMPLLGQALDRLASRSHGKEV